MIIKSHTPEVPGMTLFLSWVPQDPWHLFNKVSFWFKLDNTSFLSLATKKVVSNTEHVYSRMMDPDGNSGDGKEVLAAVTDGSEGSLTSLSSYLPDPAAPRPHRGALQPGVRSPVGCCLRICSSANLLRCRKTGHRTAAMPNET